MEAAGTECGGKGLVSSITQTDPSGNSSSAAYIYSATGDREAVTHVTDNGTTRWEVFGLC
jgi:hypothetical protein